jgi:hypothetical protein
MKKLKITLLALAALAIISTSTVYASFPVKKANKTELTSKQDASKADAVNTTASVKATDLKEMKNLNPTDAKGLDEKWITLILWFFLGGFAAHRWYAKKPVGWNILYIITFGGCGVWALVDLINILTDNF